MVQRYMTTVGRKMVPVDRSYPRTFGLAVDTRWIALALLAAIGALWAAMILLGWTSTPLGDFDAYWQAGERVRSGAPLYFTPADPLDGTIYRYAPWFTWVWAPLTYLPEQLVKAAWAVLLALSGIYSLHRVWRHPVIFLLGPAMLAAVYYGNVQALMVAGLVFGLERRSGPVWIALAASLKAVPILFVLVYLGRREWAKAAWTLGLTALLVAPMLAYDLSAYPVSGQGAGLYVAAPVVWALVTLAGMGATVYLARSRYAWLAAASTVLVALPRFAAYEMTLLLASRGTGRTSAVSSWPRHSARRPSSG